jgi:hypothetical protein
MKKYLIQINVIAHKIKMEKKSKNYVQVSVKLILYFFEYIIL